MAHPLHHAESSARKFGGVPSDYQSVHDWFDASKEHLALFTHRAMRHHAEGIFMAGTIFGPTLTLSTGRIIPTRWVAEQYVKEDLGFIPSFADWVKAIRPEPWMGRTERIEAQVDPHLVSPVVEVT
ncbi:hypothetical protein ACSSVY_004390 [Roseovarius sp. MBR-51]